MAVATFADVAVAIGRPIDSDTELAQVTYWLNGVEMVIRARLGDVSMLDQDVLRYVETEVVAARVRRAGTQESSITVSVDDGSVTRRYDNGTSAEDITDEWWSMLAPGFDQPSASIRPSFEPDLARWPVSTPPLTDWR